MKIQKVVQITNLGKFENYSPHGNVTFKDFTLIYGENGKGKTTLCTIFRSLKSGNIQLLSEKKRAGITRPIEVKILLEGNTHANFSETSKTWTQQNPDIEIFDSCHVNNNVYSGDHVDHNHKKNLYYLVIGETGVELAQNIEQLDNEIKISTDQMKLKETEIKGNITSNCTVIIFINLQKISDIDQKLIDIEKEIRSLEEAEIIKNTANLSQVVLPGFLTDELKTILASSLDSVSREAESKVKSQCELLGTKGEGWIKQGVDFLGNNLSEKCPFCGQNIDQLDLIHFYQDFFDQGYKDLKYQISTFFQRFEASFGYQNLPEINSKITNNKTLRSFWTKYLSIPEIDFNFDEIQLAREAILSRVKVIIEQKEQTPLDVIPFPIDLKKAFDQYETIKDSLSTYNKQVVQSNTRIAAKKTETELGNLENSRKRKQELIDVQARYLTDIDKLCNEYLNIEKNLAVLKSQKQAKSDELKKYSESVLEKYKETINDYLKKFGAEFEIVDPKTSLQGGKPSANYLLKVNDIVIPLGTTETEGEPCFRTILSDGDKNSLAFAFYMAQIKLDPALKDKTIIIDDPITSLDIHRKNRTFQEIREISKSAKQTIILSHDAHFLKLFCDGIHNTKTLQIIRDGNQSVIREWDIESETLPSYLQDYYRLEKYYSKGESDLRGVVRCIRPVLEGYLRFRFPKSFGIKEWLGDFIEKIRNAGSASPLDKLKPYLSELESICSYSSRFHHQQNPLADSEEITDTELKTYAKATLVLIDSM